MNIIPTHLVVHYEKRRAEARELSTAALSTKLDVLGPMAEAWGNAGDYAAFSVRAIHDELAERADGVRYDLYTRAGKVIR
jgi:muconolactone delta-isomerase